jgi:cytochrome c oxidase subunit 2
MSNKISHYLEIGGIFLLTIVSTILLNTFVLNNENLLPAAASLQAKDVSNTAWIEFQTIDGLFNIHWILISFFFSLIVIFILWSILRSWLKFGINPSDDGNGEFLEGNMRLEVFWTIAPTVIVIALAVMGATTLANVERRDPNPVEINVIAAQWSWQFVYPDANNATSVDLYVPVNQQVVLSMRSEDVIHSFWVPEFRVKQDVLPADSFTSDYVRKIRFTPTETGTYKLRCAELCGQQHYAMLATVVVVSEDEYVAWIAEQAAGCELSDAECGERWVTDFGCVACHSFDGSVIVGPTWQGLAGSTVSLADGTSVVADGDYLISSILDPNLQIHDGFQPNVMPANFGERLSEEQIAQIVAFIQSLGQ